MFIIKNINIRSRAFQASILKKSVPILSGCLTSNIDIPQYSVLTFGENNPQAIFCNCTASRRFIFT